MSIPSQVGPQHSQKPTYHYKPYDKKDSKPMVQSSAAPEQPWRQFGPQVMAIVVVLLTTVFQSMSGVVRILNDNYCKDPQVQLDLRQKFSKQHAKDCVLKTCCNSCSYCRWYRAAKKEKPKSLSLSDRNKACKKCCFCLSVSFCPLCTKCPQCCRKSTCRRQVTKVLGNMAQPRF